MILYYISYVIAWYCIVGFGARAVSRKTPIYFIYIKVTAPTAIFKGDADDLADVEDINRLVMS